MSTLSSHWVQNYYDLQEVLESAGLITVTSGTKTDTPTVTGTLDEVFTGEDIIVTVTNYDSGNFYWASSSGTSTVSGSISYIWTTPVVAGAYDFSVYSAAANEVLSDAGIWSVDVIGGNDSYTVLLLHLDGSHQSGTFTDDSVGGSTHSFSASGSADLTTTYKQFGTASLNSPAGTNYIYSASNADFGMGTGDFTIDYWLKLDSFPTSYGGIWSIGQGFLGNGTPHYQECFYYSDGRLRWCSNLKGGSAEPPPYLSLMGTGPYIFTGTWHHIAHVRNGNDFRLFVDGVKEDEYINQSLNFGAYQLKIGSNEYGPGTDMNGQVDEFRISKGVVRWWDNFNVPTRAYS